MDKTAYRECVPMSEADSKWLEYYDQAYIDGTNTDAEDRKQEYLGAKYIKTPTRDWYYQWNKDEGRYYVVVD